MQYINIHEENDILIIELNRPSVLNAINLGMANELIKVFGDAEASQDIRVIMLRGTGDKSFSSGGDLLEFHSITSREAAYDMMKRVADLLNVIASSSKLTIAAINGYALGGGAELSTAFDIRIASANAKIGFVQSKLGITSAWGGGSRLISMIGRAKALPLLLSGEMLSVEEWFKIGYVDRVYPAHTFRTESTEYAQKMTERSIEVIKAYKILCQNLTDTQLLQKSIAAEMNNAAALWISDEHLQAANKFVNKNK